jgi:hypothetical protein
MERTNTDVLPTILVKVEPMRNPVPAVMMRDLQSATGNVNLMLSPDAAHAPVPAASVLVSAVPIATLPPVPISTVSPTQVDVLPTTVHVSAVPPEATAVASPKAVTAETPVPLPTQHKFMRNGNSIHDGVMALAQTPKVRINTFVPTARACSECCRLRATSAVRS